MAKAESRNLHQRLEALNARVKDTSLRGAWQKEPKEKKEEVRPWLFPMLAGLRDAPTTATDCG